jgi:hypothetical protein
LAYVVHSGDRQLSTTKDSGRSGTERVSRTGTPDSSIFPNATLPARFPDLALNADAIGQSVQFFDADVAELQANCFRIEVLLHLALGV